jgi:hypothetical protein
MTAPRPERKLGWYIPPLRPGRYTPSRSGLFFAGEHTGQKKPARANVAGCCLSRKRYHLVQCRLRQLFHEPAAPAGNLFGELHSPQYRAVLPLRGSSAPAQRLAGLSSTSAPWPARAPIRTRIAARPISHAPRRRHKSRTCPGSGRRSASRKPDRFGRTLAESLRQHRETSPSLAASIYDGKQRRYRSAESS